MSGMRNTEEFSMRKRMIELARRNWELIAVALYSPTAILVTMFGGNYGALAVLISLCVLFLGMVAAIIFAMVRALHAKRYREILEQVLFFGVLGALVIAPMHIADTRYGISPLLTLPPLTGVGMLAAHVLVRIGLIRPTSPGASSPHASP